MNDMKNAMNICTIDDIAIINRGKSKHRPRGDSILYGGNYPFIQTSEIKKSILHINEYENTYNEVGLAQSKLWEKGTLCLTIAANIAETGILDFDACFPDSVIGIIPKEGMADTIYIKYLMDMFKVYMQQISKGTTQDNLSLEKIRKVKFEIPIYEQQLKIANFLSKYDILIEKNCKRIKILEQMAEELYKEWFVRCRFPEYKDYKFKHEKPKGWVLGTHNDMKIPQDWSFGKVENIGNFSRGKNITKEQMIEGNVPVISAGIEPSGYHNASNVKGMSLTMSASGANAGYLKYNLEDIWAADCSYYQDDSNIWFMYHSLNFIRKAIDNLQVGSAQPHVYPKNINKLCIMVPEEKYIKKFNELVSPVYLEIKRLQEKNKNLEKQRDLLLPRLMSGKLEVK